MRKYIASGILTLMLAVVVGAYGVVRSGSGDSSPNSVIKGGVDNVSELRDDYNTDETPGTKNIFAYFGLTSSVINSAKVVSGEVTKSGNVVVGGKTIATNAVTAGRQYMPGSSTQTYGGTTFYVRTPSVSFLSNSLASYVFLDSNGQFIGAVIKDCGNPVKADKPTPPPTPEPVYSCDSLTPKVITRDKYKFTTAATAKNGASIVKYSYDFGDGKTESSTSKTVSHTYAKAGTYTAKVTVYFKANDKTYTDSEGCTAKVTIKDAPKQPVAACVELRRNVISKNVSNFVAKAEVANGAKVEGYVFTIKKADTVVQAKRVTTANLTAESGNITLQPGAYTASVAVKTSIGDKSSTKCAVSFTIKKDVPPVKYPAVEIEKTVNGSESAVVEADEPFTYELVVMNTGDVDLKNVVVSDKQPAGVTFISVDDNLGKIENGVWTYTIPVLKQGEANAVHITIDAKVTEYHASAIPNTACVNAPEINPNTSKADDCDDATITMEKEETPPPDEEEETEETVELPKTGPVEVLGGVFGLGSFTAALCYYVAVRRQF